jgi:hypothetical protein
MEIFEKYFSNFNTKIVITQQKMLKIEIENIKIWMVSNA